MAAHAKARTEDAITLLSDAGVNTLADAVRGIRIVLVRVEPLIKDLIKSNRENAVASRTLTAELRRGRRIGERDRKKA